MTKIKALIFLFVILLSFSGCTHHTELYQRLIIKAVGIDKTSSGYSITVRVADYAEDKEYNLTSSGESVFAAMSDLQLAEGRTPMYSHSHFIIIGRDVLNKDLQSSLDFFIRYYRAHPSVEIFGAAKTAAEVLKYKNEDGFIPSDRIIKLSTAKDISGKAVSTSLMKLVSGSVDASGCAMIPEMSLTSNGAAITGTYILKDYKYALRLTDFETMGLLAAQGELKSAVVTAEHDELGQITAEVSSCQGKITSSEDHRTWQIDVKLDMSLASIDLGSFALHEESYKAMENSLAVVMKNYISSAISAAYSSGSDALSLGLKVNRSDPDYWKENSENWLNMMSSMEFNINVTARLQRLGEEDHPNGS